MPTILVIDDDHDVRCVISLGLKRRQFNVLEASNVREALEHARMQPPDLVLCDWNLGEVDGDATVALLRKHPATAHSPLILMSGQPLENSSADEILRKPFDLVVLLKAIQGQLNLDLRKQAKQPNNNSGEGENSGYFSPPPWSSDEKWDQYSSTKKLSAAQLGKLLSQERFQRERERTELVRLIHDDLAQTLTVVAIELSLLDTSLNDPHETALADCRAPVKRIRKLVRKLMFSTEEIMAQLRPKVLDELGFVPALEWLVQRVEKKTNMKCRMVVEGPEQILNSAIASELYRLTEEILSRAADDTRATAVSILLSTREGCLCLEVKDNGGKPHPHPNDPGSMRLLAMRQRAESMEAVFEARVFPGKGSVIHVRVPLHPQGSL